MTEELRRRIAGRVGIAAPAHALAELLQQMPTAAEPAALIKRQRAAVDTARRLVSATDKQLAFNDLLDRCHACHADFLVKQTRVNVLRRLRFAPVPR
ncbi:MAG: hypothetical protein H6707_01830 [Deltaproteobacteria bacterium]|nr:hypothetical protein [Deltaproteobacteria bacterium]